MSIEENSTETQGVKVYRVNRAAIEDMDWQCFYDLCQLMDFTPNDKEVEKNRVKGWDDEGDCYEVYFEDGEIVIVLDENESSYKPGSDAFALAITYGIYEEA